MAQYSNCKPSYRAAYRFHIILFENAFLRAVHFRLSKNLFSIFYKLLLRAEPLLLLDHSKPSENAIVKQSHTVTLCIYTRTKISSNISIGITADGNNDLLYRRNFSQQPMHLLLYNWYKCRCTCFYKYVCLNTSILASIWIPLVNIVDADKWKLTTTFNLLGNKLWIQCNSKYIFLHIICGISRTLN